MSAPHRNGWLVEAALGWGRVVLASFTSRAGITRLPEKFKRIPPTPLFLRTRFSRRVSERGLGLASQQGVEQKGRQCAISEFAARGEYLMKNVYQVGVNRAGHTFSMDRRCLVLRVFSVQKNDEPQVFPFGFWKTGVCKSPFFKKKLAGNEERLKCLCFKKSAVKKILTDF